MLFHESNLRSSDASLYRTLTRFWLGAARLLTADLQRDGYHVAEFRTPQKIILALAGQPVRPGTEWSLLPQRPAT